MGTFYRFNESVQYEYCPTQRPRTLLRLAGAASWPWHRDVDFSPCKYADYVIVVC